MVRRWLLQPDLEIQTPEGPLAIVSMNALIDELAQLAPIIYRQGGVVSIVQQRVPGFIEGEMLTTAAVFEWKDRTDSRPVPPQQPAAPDVTEFLPEPEPTRPAQDEEEEVDESSIPVAMRG